MKKKFIALLLLTFTLSACGSKKEETKSEVKQEEKKEVAKEEKKEVTEEKKDDKKIELNKEMKVGKYSITFTEYKIVKDSDNKPALRVTYDWKNEDDKSVAPFVTFSLKEFQNNVETDSMRILLKDVDLGKGQKEVKPGGKIQGAHTVVGIDSLDKPLTLELDEIISFDSKPLTVELNLSDIAN